MPVPIITDTALSNSVTSLSRYGAGNWLDMSNHTLVYDWSGQIQVVMIVYDSTPLLPDLPNEDNNPV